jgi:hypothetical protein
MRSFVGRSYFHRHPAQFAIIVRLVCLVLMGINLCAAADTTSDSWDDFNTSATPLPSWGTGPSIHALLGGEGSIPGGTQALGQNTSAMSLMFEHPSVFGRVGIAIRYLNEGFLGPQNEPWPLMLKSPLHYRDAFSLLFDYWMPISANCRVAAALGPETYFDTTANSFRWSYGDRHGMGLQTNVIGQCHLTSRFSIEMMVSRSFDVASFDSTAVLFGLVFTPRASTDLEPSDERESAVRHDRVEVAVGRIDLDNFDVSHDDGSVAWVEYAHPFTDSLGVALSLLRERVADVLDRRGTALELTAQHRFFTPRLQLFVGIGPYLARTTEIIDRTTNAQINLLLEYGLRVAIGKHFSLALKLGRVAAASGRNDSDLITVGIGYSPAYMQTR